MLLLVLIAVALAAPGIDETDISNPGYFNESPAQNKELLLKKLLLFKKLFLGWFNRTIIDQVIFSHTYLYICKKKKENKWLILR